MKRIHKLQIATVIFISLAALLALNACSGVLGGQSGVRISVDGLSGGRFISSSANSGYVVVLKKDNVYSLNNFSDKAYYALLNGQVYIANLPEGDYIFGVALVDDNGTSDENDDVNYGLAIKEVTIQPGFNDVPIDVGPGINTFTINGVDFEDFFTPDGYSVTFEGDTLILDINRQTTNNVVFTTNDGAASPQLINNDGSLGASSWTVGTSHQGVLVTVSGGLLPYPYTYRIILK